MHHTLSVFRALLASSKRSNKGSSRRLLGTCLALLAFVPAFAQAEDVLARRIMLGTQVQPVSPETRQRLGLRNSRGVEVVSVIPNSTAAEAGLQQGDVILGVGGKDVANTPAFVDVVSTLRSGQEIELRFNRDGAAQTIKLNPKELARETSETLDIEYASVATDVGNLRTVLSLPKNKSSLPVVVLLSGLGNGMAEHPVADQLGMKGLAYALNQRGFAVLRVDKPGCGDSQGGPARDVDFNSVVSGYVAGVRAVKKHPRINPKQVFLFGASMGGVQAPLVAAAEPVQGIGIFGAMSCNWSEYIQSTTSRQMKMSGADAAQVEQQVKALADGWRYLSQENLTPDEIAEKHPELTDWIEQDWTDGKYFSGISYRFFQQLCQTDVVGAWQKFNGPVLALWGESDFVTSLEDHAFVAKIASDKHQGRGEVQSLAGVDHNMRKAASIEDAASKPSAEPATDVVADAVAKWLARVIDQPRG